MGSLRVPARLKRIGAIFSAARFNSYLVGGATRNMLLGLPVGDFDIATDAQPGEVKRLFDRVIPTGIDHGTVTVLFGGDKLEVTTFRSETSYLDGRRPDSVEFIGSIENDLLRRDFTVNAIALDLVTGEVVDPTGGRDDVKRRIIRAIGDPDDRFREDALRIIRACRFSAQLEFEVEPATRNALERHVGSLSHLSSERIRDELFKMLASRTPSIGIRLMSECSILAETLPELERCRGVEQKGFHRLDVFDHSLEACDAAPADDLTIRTSALLHDIGKPDTKRVDSSGLVTFHRHEHLSADMARSLLRRLRCSRTFERRVVRLIANHMFHYESNWSDAAVRRFLRRVGPEHIDSLLRLRRADIAAITGAIRPEGADLRELRSRINRSVAASDALSIRDLAIDGNQLNALGGIPKDKDMGTVLRFLLEAVMDDPTLNETDKLFELASNFYDERIRKPPR